MSSSDIYDCERGRLECGLASSKTPELSGWSGMGGVFQRRDQKVLGEHGISLSILNRVGSEVAKTFPISAFEGRGHKSSAD